MIVTYHSNRLAEKPVWSESPQGKGKAKASPKRSPNDKLRVTLDSRENVSRHQQLQCNIRSVDVAAPFPLAFRLASPVMDSPANKKFKLCLVLALLFVALTGSALSTPLSRAKFNFSPDLTQFHPGTISHTFLEVSASLPEFAPATNFPRTDDLQIVEESHG